MGYDRIVVKLGTSVLTRGTPHLDRAHMVDLVRQCAALHAAGHDVIVCSSGAIAAGRERLHFAATPDTLAGKQMLAAVGQSRLMFVWETLFDLYGIHVGQILLTREDVENRHRFLNASDTLRALLERRIIPIVNENDAVATAEIKVGDNDNLSAFVALLAGADLLILLTDQGGLFTADPRTHPEAELIPEVRTIDETLRRVAGGSVSGLGVGGMTTKLQAADVACRAGAAVVVASGFAPDAVRRIAAGEPLGTRFPAAGPRHEHRTRWIRAGVRPGAALVADADALRALQEAHTGLMPQGVLAVEGAFERGDTVVVLDPDGRPRACGVSRYGSGDARRLTGCPAEEISARLGYAYGPFIVHADDVIPADLPAASEAPARAS